MVANVGGEVGKGGKKFSPREITRQLNIALDKDFAATAFAVLRNVIAGSPVGNPDNWALESLPPPPGYVGGHFRRNWQVSTGQDLGEIEGVDTTAGAEPMARGKAVIDAKSATAGTGGIRLIIQNNVPYANRLAHGWSRQAEAGWIDRQVDAALPTPGGRKDLP